MDIGIAACRHVRAIRRRPNCALVAVFLFRGLIIFALPEPKEEIHKTMIEISVRPSWPLDNYQKGF